MIGSDDSLDFLPDLSMSDEYEAIPIKCWQSVCLSKVWIPSYLLPTRKNPPDTRAKQGIFHTLQKRDHAKRIESFSVYSDSDGECDQEEIFVSDSDEETLGLDTFSSEKIECTTNKLIEKSSAVTTTDNSVTNKHSKKRPLAATNENKKDGHSKNVNKLKSFSSLNNLSSIDTEESTQFASSGDQVIENNLNEFEVAQKHTVYNKGKNQDSHISLHEILDNTADIDMKDVLQNFTALKKDDVSGMQEGYGETNRKKNKKEKKKKKTAKVIGLGEFLEDYEEGDRQDDYCKDYLRKLLAEQGRSGNVQMRNPAEFPDLTAEEFHFVNSQKAETKPEPRAKTFSEIFAQFGGAGENQSVEEDASGGTAVTSGLEASFGKIAIENIPLEVHQEDVYSLLSGYGEIKSFSLNPHRHFLKAVVEIDLSCDIDWIIECLNGTEPFGASPTTLKCYKFCNFY